MKIEICDQPIFVVGAPRSGTSMMQWALRQHPQLWGGQESDYLAPLLENLAEVHAYGSRREKLHWLSGQSVGVAEFLSHVGYGLNSLYMSRSGGLRWVEQTPQYTLHLEGISRLFPGAVFLFMLRDGRQVVSSLRRFVAPVEHEEACRIWANFTRHGLEFAASEAGDRLRTVSFERIVSTPDQELRAIYDWLGLEDEPASAAFIRDEAPINSSFAEESSQQKTRPRWMDWTEDERRYFHEVAGDLLIDLGFEDDDRWLKEPPADPART